MAAGAAVFCPECGAKNKPGWEFCARCGGALKGATSAPPQSQARSAPEPGTPRGRGLLTFLAVVASVIAAAWFLVRPSSESPNLNSDIFTIPGTPATPPPAVSAPPDRPDLARVRKLLAQGDHEAARTALAAAIETDPEDAGLRAMYAQLLWRAGEREAALEHFRAAAAKDPGARLDCARALEAAGFAGEALEHYRGAVEHSPSPEALKALGNALLAAGRPGEAVAPLKAVAEKSPGDVLTAQQLASALERSGDLPAAEAAYRQVLAGMPGAAISRGRLAEVLQAQGRGQEAVELLREGLRSAPANPNLQRSLGAVLDRAGQAAEAAAAFREFVRLAPNDPEVPRVQQRLAELAQPIPAAP